MRGEVEERSQAPLTAEHLARLGRLVSTAHEQLKARRPDLAGTLVAGVLAQGAAAHYLHPDAGVGVKDLDLWLFYAQRDGVRKVQERGRALVLDFGPSALGRHPEDPPEYGGRRVDVLTRTIAAPPGTDPADAVRAWLNRKADSPRRLRQTPVVLLWPRARCGELVWPGETSDALAEPPAPAPAPPTDAPDGLGTLLERLQTTPVPLGEGERLPTAGGVPTGPGLYAWWAAPRSLPEVAGPAHPTQPGLELLYVGIARDLRKRVLANHAHGGTGQSTLRRALASLLTDQEGYRTRRTSRTVLVAEDEQRLSGWIRDRLQLTWAEHPSPEAVEGEAIDMLAPPLNQSSNRTHPLYAVVREARARWRRSAG